MNVAIVHDSLAEFGGAERILLALLDVFSHAHVYTGFANPVFMKRFFSMIPKQRIHYSIAQAYHPLFTGHTHLFQSLAPAIWSRLNLSSYDIVIANTSYVMSNLVMPRPDALFIQYVQTLPKNLFNMEPPSRFQKLIPYQSLVVRLLRQSFTRTPYIIAISNHIKKVLSNTIHVDASVIYPPVRIPPSLPKRGAPSYYVCVSRLDDAKGIELAVTACTKLGLPLKIVGIALDARYGAFLRSLAGPTVEFLGFRTDEEIAKLYERAIAFIFTPKNEDFGIAPVEAMAHGIPVIAYWGGGAKETVTSTTGVFFKTHSSVALAQVLAKFRREKFSVNNLYSHARQFSEETFKKQLKKYIETALVKEQFR